MRPRMSGYWTTTQLVSPSICSISEALCRGSGVELRQRGLQLVAGERRHRLRDRDIMRDAGPTERIALLAPRDPPRHADRLPAGGRAVIHRSVGDLAAVEPRDLGLELEQDLQRALRDLRLIGRVAGQELAALDQMIDARRDMVAIGAAAEEERHLAGDQVAAAPSRTSCRSTAISLACVRQALRSAPASRAASGTSTNRSSIEAAPIAAASRCGRHRQGVGNASKLLSEKKVILPASASRSGDGHNRRSSCHLCWRRGWSRRSTAVAISSRASAGTWATSSHPARKVFTQPATPAGRGRRARDQLRIDLDEAGCRHRRRTNSSTLGYHCGSSSGIDSRAPATPPGCRRAEAAILPSPPISPTKRPPGFSTE